MAAQAAIVLADGQVSPANKTFNVRGSRLQPTGNSVAEWKETSAVNADGFFTLTETHSPVNSNKIEKFRIEIKTPVLQTVGTNDAGFTPAAEVDYSLLGRVEMWIPTRATQQELKDIVAYVKNYTATTAFRDMILNRDPSW